jgi:hypothetical protein
MNRQIQIQQMMGNPQFKQQYQQRLRGMNPSQILDQIANNPQAMNIPMVQNVMKMRKANDTEGLTGLAENVFGEKGQNYSDFEKQMKQFLGGN